MTPITHLHVRALSGSATTGQVSFGPVCVPCALGRGGLAYRKREGDGATPIGDWRMEAVYWRADRIRRWHGIPPTMPGRPLRTTDGWCDAVGDRRYNRAVRLPYPASAEALWRADHLYDVMIVLSHNRRPRIQGFGSAIFFHLARDGEDGSGLTPTAGCVAIRKRDFMRLFGAVTPGCVVRILPPGY